MGKGVEKVTAKGLVKPKGKANPKGRVPGDY
jgi:hypothetical protein